VNEQILISRKGEATPTTAEWRGWVRSQL